MSNVDERGFPVETISIASGLAERMKGLIGQSEKGGVVMLSPCCDIHTFGMRADLDVAFVSKSGVILESRRSVKPRTRIRCRGARAVLERFSDRRRPWFMNGDTLCITCGNVCIDRKFDELPAKGDAQARPREDSRISFRERRKIERRQHEAVSDLRGDVIR